MTIWIIVTAIILFFAYVRFAPTDIAKWHVAVPGTQDSDRPDGAIRVVDATEQQFTKAIAVLESLPRTKLIAGTEEEGHVLFLTRSAVFGFPDYTTLQFSDNQLKFHARLRFGRSDLGVNRKRLERVISALSK